VIFVADADPWTKDFDGEVLPLAERFQNIVERVATEENALGAALPINHDTGLVRSKEENPPRFADTHPDSVRVHVHEDLMLTLALILVFVVIIVMTPFHDYGLGFDVGWLAARPWRRSLEAGQFLWADGDRIGRSEPFPLQNNLPFDH
jgi:hypothetical protein